MTEQEIAQQIVGIQKRIDTLQTVESFTGKKELSAALARKLTGINERLAYLEKNVDEDDDSAELLWPSFSS